MLLEVLGNVIVKIEFNVHENLKEKCVRKMGTQLGEVGHVIPSCTSDPE